MNPTPTPPENRLSGEAAVLSAPLVLPNGQVLPNRIAKAAMSEQLAVRGQLPGDALRTLYERWSQGGSGLLITGHVMVDPGALGEPSNVVVTDGTDLASLRAWARAARVGGSKVWMQLNHPGRQSPRTVTSRPVAPSEVPLQGLGPAFAPPRALSDGEIVGIIARFGAAAAVAREAGFDGVQLHAAHGYLASQFLSPRTNRRTDRWGGSLENRMRFLRELVRAVSPSRSREFAVSVKLNSADFQRGGFDDRDALEVLKALDAEGVDLYELSGGSYERAVMWEDRPPPQGSTLDREAFFLTFADDARKVTRTPLMVTGGFRTARGMALAVRSGSVDLVGLARPLALEPDLPAKILTGRADRAARPSLKTGLRQLDALLEGGYHQHQLQRMGQGKDPEVHPGILGALSAAARSTLFSPRPGLAR